MQPVKGAGRTPQHDGQVDEALCDQLPEAWPRQARLDRQKPRVLYHLHVAKHQTVVSWTCMDSPG